MGIFSYLDVIEHLPRRYESFIYTDPDRLIRLADKERAVIYGKLITEPKVLRFRNVSNTTFMFRDAYNHDYKCVAWNRPYLGKSLNTTDPFTLQVSYDAKKHEMNVLGLKKGRVGSVKLVKFTTTSPSNS